MLPLKTHEKIGLLMTIGSADVMLVLIGVSLSEMRLITSIAVTALVDVFIIGILVLFGIFTKGE